MTDSNNMITFTLDGIPAEAFPGETILDAAVRHGRQIPTLCHDPLLKPFTSCFLCVVKVEGMKGLQPSCGTAVTGGMVVRTAGDDIFNARRTALELLLSNHYADCLGPCRLRCPAGVDIQGYIALIEKGLYGEAIALIKENNPLPAICGRVCVRPCELACRRLLAEDEGVGIDYLKRYAADRDMSSQEPWRPVPAPDTGRSVAVIGSGPAGLSAAYWLRLLGHECHIFEAAPKPGGWLRYGIPEYRLPNDILDREIESITSLGVTIFCNRRFGTDFSYDHILSRYDAMILSPGAQKGTPVGCEGDDATGVMAGIDFLRNMELSGTRPDLSGKKILVVGGGNTAMDCCRTAVRCGATAVTVIYRRSEGDMPANSIEIEESKREGVSYLFLSAPVKVITDSDGRVTGVVLRRMKAGEPDASGRPRPVEVPGSDFIVEADMVLAAIGQKSDLSFINGINAAATGGELKTDRWGNIEADPLTLQTGIPGIFAAGDGVTGPDTIIGAIAQAHITAQSCHQYLSGIAVAPAGKQFISRRDNLREPSADDLPSRFVKKTREPMPVIDAGMRVDFSEVELGYESETTVLEEVSRCMECGCSAFDRCGLRRYAGEYGAEQKHYSGSFINMKQDLSHPFIAFDLNKCILCGRCVRICHELAGTDALGFFNRGFATVIGPGCNMSLSDTDCTSCGLCTDTCPTGAITENKPFRQGTAVPESFVTTDPLGPEGNSLRLFHHGGFFVGATGTASPANRKGVAGNERFMYRLLNRERVTEPLLKTADGYKPVSYGDAFEMIASRIRAVKPSENGFFAGARLTNEEQYLVQKLARGVVGTNNIHSFHYLHRGKGYITASDDNMPHDDIDNSAAVCLFGTDMFGFYQSIGFRIFNNMETEEMKMIFVSEKMNKMMERKASAHLRVKSYYHFIRALNQHIVRNNMINAFFIGSRTAGFDEYCDTLLAEDMEATAAAAGVTADAVASFADLMAENSSLTLIFAEKDVTSPVASEIHNYALLTGLTGKKGSGIICLKESANSQGIIDNGVRPSRLPGNTPLSDTKTIDRLCSLWNAGGLATSYECSFDMLRERRLKNLFIFGEDPVGCATRRKEIVSLLSGADFLAVQDYFFTDTCAAADIILPSSFIFEAGGSFTSTGRIISITEKQMSGPVAMTGIEQIEGIMAQMGYTQHGGHQQIRDEFLQCLSPSSPKRYPFIMTSDSGNKPLFRYGCDSFAAAFREYNANVNNLPHDSMM